MKHDFPCLNVETILNSVAEAVFTVDLEWNITSFNAAAETLTGTPRNDAMGQQCRLIFRTDLCDTKCPLRSTMATGRPYSDVSAAVSTAEGRVVPVRISTAVLRNDDGTVIGGIETVRDISRVEHLRKELDRRYTCRDIIGRSPPMQKLFAVLPRIAESSSTVVIEGETGTGKEIFARAIHDLSPRRNEPFVAVNCGALPDTLLESELFGHKAGAFTDARKDKPGRFQRAHGGTIFLDEIADISPAMQVRLLRVLQENMVEPLGATKPVSIDVRVIAATNRPLKTLVDRGDFRDDLYYRIQVVHLRLPPLRRRREDIPLLVDGIIAKYNSLHGKNIAGMTHRALAALMHHTFPGNIRELENVIEQAFVLSSGDVIDLFDLPPELRNECPGVPVGGTLAAIEKSAIEDALFRHKGHRSRTAEELGIDKSTLYRKMKALAVLSPEDDGRRPPTGVDHSSSAGLP